MKKMNFIGNEWKSLIRYSKYPIGFYRLLGYILSYYAGSYNPKKEILQRITVPFSKQDEEDKVNYLKSICNSFFIETGLKNDLIINVDKDDFEQHSIYTLLSKNVCNYLNVVEYDNAADLFLPIQSLSAELSIAYRQRLEFLIGTYAYHGKEDTGEWVFWNNYQKMVLTHQFLVGFADEEDLIVVESFFRTPHTHWIKLNTNGDLWPMIESELTEMKTNAIIP